MHRKGLWKVRDEELDAHWATPCATIDKFEKWNHCKTTKTTPTTAIAPAFPRSSGARFPGNIRRLHSAINADLLRENHSPSVSYVPFGV